MTEQMLMFFYWTTAASKSQLMHELECTNRISMMLLFHKKTWLEGDEATYDTISEPATKLCGISSSRNCFHPKTSEKSDAGCSECCSPSLCIEHLLFAKEVFQCEQTVEKDLWVILFATCEGAHWATRANIHTPKCLFYKVNCFWHIESHELDLIKQAAGLSFDERSPSCSRQR